jgi:hypothetical protein
MMISVDEAFNERARYQLTHRDGSLETITFNIKELDSYLRRPSFVSGSA